MCAKMTLNCGATFVKYLLCFLNFLLFIAGGALLVVSAWVAIDTPSFFLVTKITNNDSLEDHSDVSVLETGAYILIAAGAVILLVGFLGCCGAAMESKGVLATYGALVILVFLLEVTAGILLAVYKHKVEDHLQDFLKGTLREHYANEEEANSITAAWDAFMMKMECCGVNNFTDFDSASGWNKTMGQVVPRSCCKMMTEGVEIQDGVRAEANDGTYDLMEDTCLYLPTEDNSNHLIGCLQRIQAATFYYHLPSISVAIGLGALQMIIITLSFYLCRSVSRLSKVVMVN